MVKIELTEKEHVYINAALHFALEDTKKRHSDKIGELMCDENEPIESISKSVVSSATYLRDLKAAVEKIAKANNDADQ